jgi:predicted lipid-binding transport protein (Tim44 family)
MDATWQDKLQEQQQQQQQHGLPVAANPAARGLAGWAEGALGPLAGSQWGLGALGGPDAGGAMAAVSQMLSALAPAQVMALLSNPLYLGE